MHLILSKFWGNAQDYGLDRCCKIQVSKGNRSICMKLLEFWHSPIVENSKCVPLYNNRNFEKYFWSVSFSMKLNLAGVSITKFYLFNNIENVCEMICRTYIIKKINHWFHMHTYKGKNFRLSRWDF